MLLSDHVRASSIEPFNLLTICNLQEPENTDIAGLELMGRETEGDKG
jgi:hypothetical protein